MICRFFLCFFDNFYSLPTYRDLFAVSCGITFTRIITCFPATVWNHETRNTVAALLSGYRSNLILNNYVCKQLCDLSIFLCFFDNFYSLPTYRDLFAVSCGITFNRIITCFPATVWNHETRNTATGLLTGYRSILILNNYVCKQLCDLSIFLCFFDNFYSLPTYRDLFAVSCGITFTRIITCFPATVWNHKTRNTVAALLTG
ncbi:hypothetical protein Lspi_1692 [Legionella spiritensis]|uniref:Uncharacterized protein n=1 Tax=Legionella spiritensis TaxID=452 RepID=A0A0W0Z3M6_LEGSP|nr:hypothetical protein Lspi_1692 [Legionella spiritensis]SNV35305.1 Uncharacterised protein [Legionella spiritensis]